MKKLYKTVLLVLSFIFLMSCGSLIVNTNPYWQGEILLMDGTVKKGYIMVPNSPREISVAFKSSVTAEKETIKRKSIKSVNVVSENGSRYLYENVPLVNSVKGNTSLGTALLLVVGKNDYVTFYVGSEIYKVNKKNKEIVPWDKYVQSQDFPTFPYYIRKKGKPKANNFAITGEGWAGLNARLKKSAKYHLKEDENLTRKILEDELTHTDIPEIIKIYLKTTEKL